MGRRLETEQRSSQSHEGAQPVREAQEATKDEPIEEGQQVQTAIHILPVVPPTNREPSAHRTVGGVIV